jgi:hypothetical protein
MVPLVNEQLRTSAAVHARKEEDPQARQKQGTHSYPSCALLLARERLGMRADFDHWVRAWAHHMAELVAII